MRLVVCCLLLVTGLPAPSFATPPLGPQPPASQPPAPAPKEQIPAGMTEIEGSRNPELIPDHAIWRSVFLRLVEIRRRGEEEDLQYLLPLGKDDLAAVYAEAMKQPARDDECHARYKAKQQALSQARAPLSTMWQALDELTIECRTLDLDAADRVLDTVSDEGRRILDQYIDARRHSMSMLVPNRELTTYRLPR